MTDQEFKEFIEGEKGAELKPHFDRAISRAIESYKQNHPAPADTDPDEETAEALAAQQAENLALKIENAKITECHRRGIPLDFLDDIGTTFNSIEEVSTRMERIGARFEQMRTAQTNLDLSRGFKPGVSGVGDGETVADMSPERIDFLESIGELDSFIKVE